MLVGVQQHPLFSPPMYFDYETFSSVLCNRFWHSAHFQNAQRYVAWLYIFLVFIGVFGIWPILEIHRHVDRLIFSRFHEHFFAFIGFKSFLAFGPFLKCTKACDPVIHFFRFHECFWHLAHF